MAETDGYASPSHARKEIRFYLAPTGETVEKIENSDSSPFGMPAAEYDARQNFYAEVSEIVQSAAKIKSISAQLPHYDLYNATKTMTELAKIYDLLLKKESIIWGKDYVWVFSNQTGIQLSHFYHLALGDLFNLIGRTKIAPIIPQFNLIVRSYFENKKAEKAFWLELNRLGRPFSGSLEKKRRLLSGEIQAAVTRGCSFYLTSK